MSKCSSRLQAPGTGKGGERICVGPRLGALGKRASPLSLRFDRELPEELIRKRSKVAETQSDITVPKLDCSKRRFQKRKTDAKEKSVEKNRRKTGSALYLKTWDGQRGITKK